MKFTLSSAADHLGIHRDTLKIRLQANGHDCNPNDEFTLIEIVDAYVGTYDRERIRLMRADADMREMDRAAKREILIHKQTGEQALQRVLVPLRAWLLALPGFIAPYCTSPEAAKEALTAEIHKQLEEMSKPEDETGLDEFGD